MVKKSALITLLVGDLITLLIVTLLGFSTHNANVSLFRFAANYLPLVIAWLVVAPWFGAYTSETATSPRALPQLVLAVLVCAPLAAVLRGIVLSSVVQTVFVIVLGLTNGLGIGIWRGLWILFDKRKN
ncbi:MAG: hypothetical protein CL609_25765 [Anaerolineaceae bacterium]|nr:hypothetical protein [Anaerolineaceae bacterium]